MHKIYVISDLHLGHNNLAIHRGFKSVEEHDSTIIENWNRIVNKKDTVWILGDITMEKSSNYHLLDRLLGIKNVVLGNHDKPQHVPELLKHVNKVCGAFKYKDVILTHIPIHSAEIGRFRLNIHGHMHEEIISDKRYINVSCEAINYTPQLISDLI